MINDSVISTTRESLDNTMLISKTKKNVQYKKFIEDTVMEEESGEDKPSEDICDKTRLDWNELKQFIAPDESVVQELDKKVDKEDDEEDVLKIIREFINNE